MAEWGAQPSPPMPQMRQPHSVQQPALQCRNLFRVCWDIYCNMITICMDNCPTGCHWTILKYGLSAQQRNCKWTPFFFLHSFCSGDLFKWRNHPYDVSGERLTQHILSEGEKKNTENCLKKITYYVLLKSCWCLRGWKRKALKFHTYWTVFSLPLKKWVCTNYFLTQIGFCRFGPEFLTCVEI